MLKEWLNAVFGPRPRGSAYIYVYYMYFMADWKALDFGLHSRTAFSSDSVTNYLWNSESGIEYMWIFIS